MPHANETIIEHHDEKGLRGRFKIVGRIIELIADGVGYLKLLPVLVKTGEQIMSQLDTLNTSLAALTAAVTAAQGREIDLTAPIAAVDAATAAINGINAPAAPVLPITADPTVPPTT